MKERELAIWSQDFFFWSRAYCQAFWSDIVSIAVLQNLADVVQQHYNATPED